MNPHIPQQYQLSCGGWATNRQPPEGILNKLLVGLRPSDGSVSVVVGEDALPPLAGLPLHGVVGDQVVEVVL